MWENQSTHTPIKLIDYIKYQGSCFSAYVKYEYPDSQELDELGIAEIDNAFTWISACKAFLFFNLLQAPEPLPALLVTVQLLITMLIPYGIQLYVKNHRFFDLDTNITLLIFGILTCIIPCLSVVIQVLSVGSGHMLIPLTLIIGTILLRVISLVPVAKKEYYLKRYRLAKSKENNGEETI